MKPELFALFAFLASCSAAAPPSAAAKSVILTPNHPLLHKHGRWDSAPGTWWTGSGFKLVASGLTSLTLRLGNHTTAPQAAAAVSVDYGEFTTVNITAGTNIIPITTSLTSSRGNRVVRVNMEGWQNNRMHLERIEINPGAVVKPYKPSPLRFQFIGDSLTAGQHMPRGVNDAWSFLTAQEFKAEHNINAQPGAYYRTNSAGEITMAFHTNTSAQRTRVITTRLTTTTRLPGTLVVI
ncbi:GDSL-like Lipase/Acylhydrolase family [Rhizoctonia solani]|uniref:GDSL-like Lipase/Acylhydrolase family n=1 Tax=Rhizoctonia solani TaxID=456999 RepID=A0A8H7H0B0_9AGAM|nr:GDSL-like Lipase/Acylhydrolase family [Rhizoctonia solani]